MSEKYRPIKGDRVRVVLEGEVTDTAGGSVTISDRALRGSDPDFWCSSTVADDAKFLVSVEKIEPPVEVFKEGDRLRRTDLFPYEVTLGKRGYLHHSTNSWSEFDATDRQFFNSRNFELVYRP